MPTDINLLARPAFFWHAVYGRIHCIGPVLISKIIYNQSFASDSGKVLFIFALKQDSLGLTSLQHNDNKSSTSLLPLPSWPFCCLWHHKIKDLRSKVLQWQAVLSPFLIKWNVWELLWTNALPSTAKLRRRVKQYTTTLDHCITFEGRYRILLQSL